MNRRQALLMLASQAGLLWLAGNGFAGQDKKNGSTATSLSIKYNVSRLTIARVIKRYKKLLNKYN